MLFVPLTFCERSNVMFFLPPRLRKNYSIQSWTCTRRLKPGRTLLCWRSSIPSYRLRYTWISQLDMKFRGSRVKADNRRGGTRVCHSSSYHPQPGFHEIKFSSIQYNAPNTQNQAEKNRNKKQCLAKLFLNFFLFKRDAAIVFVMAWLLVHWFAS